ncbi:uncharacterized protein T551_02581 [Pneumocystis jirovecii RU7]|uniref:Cyclin C-terminal domain-containing protein n=1 Tax=Pneumocystis jirovecii (strain RU7) TaxID=1408657 RepID=A0A0W4ZK28_PNEJ7|nr:uncharacterized protein T551_02581 [Pneumocystis jirovecii RU7]KTW28731.1 hypothetical protein T551_02581 [Pneumocystis jirovecii RU7]
MHGNGTGAAAAILLCGVREGVLSGRDRDGGGLPCLENHRAAGKDRGHQEGERWGEKVGQESGQERADGAGAIQRERKGSRGRDKAAVIARILGQAGEKGVAQRTWSYINDAMCTTIPCIEPAACIAVGCIYMAANEAGIRLPEEWWEVFDVEEEDMVYVAASLKSFYIEERERKEEERERRTPVEVEEVEGQGREARGAESVWGAAGKGNAGAGKGRAKAKCSEQELGFVQVHARVFLNFGDSPHGRALKERFARPLRWAGMLAKTSGALWAGQYLFLEDSGGNSLSCSLQNFVIFSRKTLKLFCKTETSLQ